MDIEIFDTQVWVYAANNSFDNKNDDTEMFSKAVELFREVVDGSRAVYVPRYVAAEFHSAMNRMPRRDAEENAIKMHRALEKSPWAFITPLETGAHSTYQNNLSVRRRQPETTALAEALDMEPKDAPIVAVAQRLPEFVESYNPPTHGDISIPQKYEEYYLIHTLQQIGVSDVTTRIVTFEKNFVGVDDLPLERVSIADALDA